MARLVGITAGTTKGALPSDFEGQEWLISSEDLAPCRYDVYESHKQFLYLSAAWPLLTEFAGETGYASFDASLCSQVSAVRGGRKEL
jgi:hypothetical protein